MKPTFRQLWGWPVVLGLLSASGLLSALVSEGWGDIWSWLALGGPTLLMAWLALLPGIRPTASVSLAFAPVHLPPAGEAGHLCLVDLAVREPTIISSLSVADTHASSGVVQRLAELGFMAGETICVLQHGPGGREPMAVQVGDTIFALRLHEASCIQVKALV
jgi:ferrous iron transport protein A